MLQPARSSTLVCFDLGRVLVRICDNWQHACRLAGVPVSVSEFSADRRAQLTQFVYDNETGKMDESAFAQASAPLMELEVEHVRALSDAYILGPYDGVDALFDDLAAVGVRTACLSNTNDNHWRIMSDPAHPAGVPIERLDYRFASHLIGLRKPDPAIYAHVERETGAAGESIIFFDDLDDNVAAATERGWRAYEIELDGNPVAQIRRHLKTLGIL